MDLRTFISGLINLFHVPIAMIIAGIIGSRKIQPMDYHYLSYVSSIPYKTSKYKLNKIKIKRELKYLARKLFSRKLIVASFIEIIVSTFILFFMFAKYPYLAVFTSYMSMALLMIIMAAIVDIKFYKIKKKLFSQIEKNKRLQIELEEVSKEEVNDNYKQ